MPVVNHLKLGTKGILIEGGNVTMPVEFQATATLRSPLRCDFVIVDRL